MRIEDFFVGIVVFSLVIGLGLMIYAQTGVQVSKQATENSSMDRITNLTSNLMLEQENIIKDKIVGGQTSNENAFDQMINGGYQSLRSLLANMGYVGQVLSIVALQIGWIPTIVISTITAIIGFVFIMAILYMIFRWRV